MAGTTLGERFGESPPITTEELVTTIAVYRFLHPETRVRLTGGREVNLDADEQHLPFEAGADGILTGECLTTDGQSPGDDIETIERAGLKPNTEAHEFDAEAVKARENGDEPPEVETAAGTATGNAEPGDD